MKYYYQVITTPTADTPGTSLILNYPDKKYIFGRLSEGTQRATMERSAKLTHVTDLFLTGRTEWANTGGLIGLILTQTDITIAMNAALEDARKTKEKRRQEREEAHGVSAEPSSQQNQSRQPEKTWINIHGGRNLTHTLATARRFVFRRGTPLNIEEYTSRNRAPTQEHLDPFEEPTWADSNIKVWAMPIKPSSLESGVGGSSSSIPRPQASRKRSHDEFEEDNAAAKGPLGQEAKDDILRKSVVSAMFSSSWTLDTLVETPLADVKQPTAMFVRNPETKDFEPFVMPPAGQPLPNIKVFVRTPWPASKVERIPPTTRSDESLSYIIRSQDTRGKFDPEKATKLKVKKGRDYGLLASGKSVQSEDDQTITPDMVLGPTRLGKGVAIIDLPSSNYVDALINRPEWNSPSVTTELAAIVWILGPGVGENPRLREFVAKMSQCKHIVSSTDYCPNYFALPVMASTTISLAQMQTIAFSIPYHDNATVPQQCIPTAGSETTKEVSPFVPAKPGLILYLEPDVELNTADLLRLVDPQTVRGIPRSVRQRVSVIRRRIARESFCETLSKFRRDLPGAEAEIITLGTGSSVPSKHRNVAATLIYVPGQGYYLLDCGENTLGQMKRIYGPEKLREVLQNLRMIWISHLHADHHLGTTSVIRAWYQENYGAQPQGSDSYIQMDMAKILQEKRLFLVAEEHMVGWLEEYASVEDYGFSKLVPLAAYRLPDSLKSEFVYRHVRGDGTYPGQDLINSKPSTTTLTFQDNSSPLSALLRSATGLADLLPAKVLHCHGAMAVSLLFPDGFKVSYSGDCRPSEDFVTIGHGSTILIHEATFDDKLRGSAIAKRHSTVSEAIKVGHRMKAGTILLTHFSQRYHRDISVLGLKDPDLLLDDHNNNDQVEDDPPATGLVDENKTEIEVVTTVPPRASAGAAADAADDAQPASPAETETETDVRQIPIITAFDFMRVRMKDVPIVQSFVPAVEKFFTVLENQSAEDARRSHLEAELAKKAAAAAKNKNKKKDLQMQMQDVGAGGAAAVAPLQDGDKYMASREKSVWSASESESGWWSGGEIDGEL